MQLQEALSQGIHLLEKARIPSPRLTAEVLLMHAAQCDRAHLHAHPEWELADSERVHYGRYLKERLEGKPTQYITGHQEFWGMDLLVNASVLIPRPETECLVEAALELARRHLSSSDKLCIADVGTGSGCIAIALARELAHARIYALDQSPDALDTARKNAQLQGVASRIVFSRSDLLECVLGEKAPGEKFPELQMVVSNPPYVAERDGENVAREVAEFEPRSAIFAGESGREIYSRLIPEAARSMPSGGYLALELGYDSQEWVRRLLQPPEWGEVRWLPDLAGIVRVATARRLRRGGETRLAESRA